MNEIRANIDNQVIKQGIMNSSEDRFNGFYAELFFCAG